MIFTNKTKNSSYDFHADWCVQTGLWWYSLKATIIPLRKWKEFKCTLVDAPHTHTQKKTCLFPL